jgi:hypothetical protein
MPLGMRFNLSGRIFSRTKREGLLYQPARNHQGANLKNFPVRR